MVTRFGAFEENRANITGLAVTDNNRKTKKP